MPCKSSSVASISLIMSLAASLSCGNGVGPSGDATIGVRADVSGTSVATVVLDVTAPDISPPLTFNIPIVNRVAVGTITVPAGSKRTLIMRAFDAGSIETDSGSITLDIRPGGDPNLTLVLQPLTGDVPINVTLGSIVITVTPATATVARGDTLRLAAALTDWKGQPMVGTALWATDNPGVAFVDASGLVTARQAGSTTISATFHGAAGSAAVTVTP